MVNNAVSAFTDLMPAASGDLQQDFKLQISPKRRNQFTDGE